MPPDTDKTATKDPDLLRFLTCGSVDDGKSTLLGRLLAENSGAADDQLAAAVRDSRRLGTVGDDIDYALLVDGLESEREQGITIDVAYRFFATPRRAFIAADAPGHEQYTRNMATAASTADLAILLVDVGKGLRLQTRRHARIAALMGIRDVVLAVNKIDLAGCTEDAFARVVTDFAPLADELRLRSWMAVPLSARFGDNVCRRSTRTPWYAGPSLIEALEQASAATETEGPGFRFPVQTVIRSSGDFRGLAGTVAAGRICIGDDVVVAGSGQRARVARIVTFDGFREEAQAGDAVALVLEAECDVGRGTMLADPAARPDVADQFSAHLVWLSERPLHPGRTYLLRCGTCEVPARVTLIKHRIDITTSAALSAKSLGLNDIAVVDVATDGAIAFDPYAVCRRTGAFLLIDRESSDTAGAGMIRHALRRATNIARQHHRVTPGVRAAAKRQRPMILWFTGLSGSGKSTIADLVEARLAARGVHTMLLDGDNIRHGLNRDLGFGEADRVENIRRAGEVAKLMVDAGLVVLCAFISPYAAERTMVREMVPGGTFVEIFVDTPLEVCIARDPKGLYGRALAGLIPNFTGISAPYERPETPEIRIDGGAEPPEVSAERLIAWLDAQGFVAA